MNRPLQEAAVTDPKWARKEQRREWLLKAVTAGVLIALTVGVLTIFQNRGQDQQITKITRTVETPCQRAPAGEECAAIRRAVALQEPRANPCVSYQRVTGHKGKNCRRFYVGSESKGPSFNATPPSGGDASPVGTTGSQPSGPPNGGSTGTGKGRGGDGDGPDGGQGETPAASPVPDPGPVPPGAPPEASPGRSSDAPGNPDPPPSSPGPLPSTVEAAGGAVGDVVEGAGKSIDCVLRGAC